MSFSSDTGMAECLVVARKRGAGGVDQRIRFTSLAHRPRGFAEASAVGKHIAAVGSVRSIDDGPYGGTRLPLGEGTAGEMLTTPPAGDGENWGSVRLLDYYLAQTAYALTRSELWLPRAPRSPRPAHCAIRLRRPARTGPSGHNRPAATWPVRQDRTESDGNLSCSVEPQLQKGNPYGLRTGLATAGTPGNGG